MLYLTNLYCILCSKLKTRKKKKTVERNFGVCTGTYIAKHPHVELVLIITLVYYSLKKQLSYDRALTNTIYSQSIY